METLLVGCISGGVTLIVCVINNICQARNIKTQNDKAMALIQYRIEALTKTVEKHNNLCERMIAVERDVKTVFNFFNEIRAELEQLKTEMRKK